MGYATGDAQKGPDYFDSTWIDGKYVFSKSNCKLFTSALVSYLCFCMLLLFILQFSVVDMEPPQESGANDKQSLGRLAFRLNRLARKNIQTCLKSLS